MAGGKETPRQKMIGMMYLVLTALLALNVSKEIINAFVTQDEQLLTTNNNLVQGINELRNKFTLLEVDMSTKEKYKRWKPKVDSIVELANQLDDYLLDQKNELLYQAEKQKDWFAKNGASQLTTWKDFEAVSNKSDYDIATRLFGGEKGSDGYKKGAEIRRQLIQLRDKFILTVGNFTEGRNTYVITKKDLVDLKTLETVLDSNKHPEKGKLLSIYQTLSQPEKLKNHGEMQDWQLVKFDHQPVVGAIGVFTELRNQVRIAEQKSLETVFNKMESHVMRINKVQPQVISNTRYINMGDTIGVKVGIVAYDTTASYPIKYVIGGEEQVKDNNYFTVKGTSPGEQKIEGTIALEMADGIKEFPWSFNYNVGQPQATVSLPELNVMYRNHDNIIEVAASGFNPEDVKANCSDCSSFQKQGNKYVATVGRGTRKTVNGRTGYFTSIRVQAPGLTYTKEYQVLALPKPELSFVGENGENSSVQIKVLEQGTKLILKSPESSPLRIKYDVVSFDVEFIKGGKPRGDNQRNIGDKLSGSEISLLKDMKKNDKISFYNIKYKVNGTGPTLNLPGGLTLKAR